MKKSPPPHAHTRCAYRRLGYNLRISRRSKKTSSIQAQAKIPAPIERQDREGMNSSKLKRNQACLNGIKQIQTSTGNLNQAQTESNKLKRNQACLNKLKNGLKQAQTRDPGSPIRRFPFRQAKKTRITTPRSCTRRSRRRGHSTPGVDHNICRPADRRCTDSSRCRKQPVSGSEAHCDRE